MKTILIIIVIIFGIGVWFFVSKSSTPQADIIARNGLHWHSSLSINIFGEPQEIPGGIGLENLPHKPIHTHDRDGVIHMEFTGLVKKDDIKLGKFFQIWGKTFPEGKMSMLVNGKENGEFENYIMQDNDKIEIIFKKEENTSGVIKEITVIGTEFAFSPANLTMAAGEKIKLTFKNNGSASHNLAIEGLGISTKTISSGKTDTIEFTSPAAGTYNFFCSIPGHRPAGMEGILIVK